MALEQSVAICCQRRRTGYRERHRKCRARVTPRNPCALSGAAHYRVQRACMAPGPRAMPSSGTNRSTRERSCIPIWSPGIREALRSPIHPEKECRLAEYVQYAIPQFDQGSRYSRQTTTTAMSYDVSPQCTKRAAILGDRGLPGNWFARFRNPVDGCDQQRSVVSRPGNAPLPPSRRSNQAGNPRHSLPFAEREQVVGEIVVASRSGPRGALLALSRLALRRQGPCASQLSENPILIPSIGAEQVENAALSLGKRTNREAVIQRTPRVVGYRAAIVATSGGGDPDDRLLPTFANAASVVP